MTIILELAPEVEARLRRKADRAGQEVADYLLAIADREEEEDSEEEETEGSAYDLFAGRLGGVHSGGQGRWSENTGEKFAAGMEEKRRQGHL